jgi:predicted PurR-regulated permease PerM
MNTSDKNLHGTAVLIERVVAVALFVGLLTGVALVLAPFTTAILFGGIIVIATWPVHEWLLRKGLSNGVAALVLTLASIALIVVPAVILAPRLGGQLVELFSRAQKMIDETPDLPAWLTELPVVGTRIKQFWSQLVRGEIQAILSPYSTTLRKGIIGTGTALAEGMLQLVLSLAVAAMLWLRGDLIKGVLETIARRFAGSFGEQALSAAAGSVKGVAYGIVGTALAQAFLLTIGMLAAGIPNATVLGFLALLIALSQFGILLTIIWGGAAWWLFSMGSAGWGFFMIVWGLFVSMADNVIRPFLVGFGAAMPITLIFLGVFGGFIAFGFLGMFIGPTLLAVFLALLQAWRLQPERRLESSGPTNSG